MGDKTLETIAEAMRDIDFCMFSTKTEGGALATCPMSTNREVEYDGPRASSPMTTPVWSPTSPSIPTSRWRSKANPASWDPPISSPSPARRNSSATKPLSRNTGPPACRCSPEGIDTPGLVMIAVAANGSILDGEDGGEMVI